MFTRSLRRVSALLLPVVLTGCATVQAGTGRTSEVAGSIIHAPVIANLTVGNTKVSGEATGTTATSVDLLKNNALRAALNSAKADVLVAASYTIESASSRVTVTVTGYPATYNNFRNLESKDLQVLEGGAKVPTESSVSVSSEKVVPTQKGAGALVVLGSILLLGTLIPLMSM